MDEEFTDIINKKYGRWVSKFNDTFNKEPEPTEEEVQVLVGVIEMPFTRQEIWKLVKSSYTSTTHAHGFKVSISWAHSFYKRLWSMMRDKKRNKERLLREKQQEHIDFNLKRLMPLDKPREK